MSFEVHCWGWFNIYVTAIWIKIIDLECFATRTYLVMVKFYKSSNKVLWTCCLHLQQYSIPSWSISKRPPFFKHRYPQKYLHQHFYFTTFRYAGSAWYTRIYRTYIPGYSTTTSSQHACTFFMWSLRYSFTQKVLLQIAQMYAIPICAICTCRLIWLWNLKVLSHSLHSKSWWPDPSLLDVYQCCMDIGLIATGYKSWVGALFVSLPRPPYK